MTSSQPYDIIDIESEVNKMKYVVTVEKKATYFIEANSETQALNIADEWLNERGFDKCDIRAANEEDE